MQNFTLEKAPTYRNPDNVAESFLRERNTLWNLLRWMESKGFTVYKVFDGEEDIRVTNIEQALSACDAVDESTLFYKHPTLTYLLSLDVMLGEGEDGLIVDHTYNVPTGFNATIENYMYVQGMEYPTFENGDGVKSLLLQAYEMPV